MCRNGFQSPGSCIGLHRAIFHFLSPTPRGPEAGGTCSSGADLSMLRAFAMIKAFALLRAFAWLSAFGAADVR
jgi:hypothetical protein